MRKLKWLVTILVAIVISLAPVTVQATNPIDVTVTNSPWFTAGISSFTITYISNTDMQLNWVMDSPAYPVANIMIRAKYSAYPTDITDPGTAPTDGYLVYYGDGLTTTSVDDMSMDFSQNPGPLYYKAWAQKTDGTWYTSTNNGSQESRDVILATLFGVSALGAIVFTVMGYTKRQPILALFGSAFFLIMGGFSYTQSLLQWDVWYDLMFVSFIFGGLIAMVAFSLDRTERAARRTKAAAEKAEAARPRTTQEQWAKSQQEADDMYQQTHLPRARRRSHS